MIKPLYNFFSKSGLSADAATWAGFALALIAAALFASGKLAYASYVVIAAATFDMLDGYLARQNASKKTAYGPFLDSVLDRLGELFIFGGILFYLRGDPTAALLCYGTIGFSQLVSYLRARAEGLGVDCEKGFFQRAERMIVTILVSGFSPLVKLFIDLPNSFFLKLLLSIILIGSIQTTLSRAWLVYNKLKHKNP